MTCLEQLLWPLSASVGFDSIQCMLFLKESHPMIG